MSTPLHRCSLRCCEDRQLDHLSMRDVRNLGKFVVGRIWLHSLGELRRLLSNFSRRERYRVVSQVVERTTALLLACNLQDLDTISYLLEECDAPVNQMLYPMAGTNMQTIRAPILEPIKEYTKDSASVLEILLRHGADVNMADLNRQFGRRFCPPLHEAHRHNHMDLVKMLLDAGADVNARDSLGRTCLSYAAERLPVEAIRRLVALGADVNCADYNQRSPLHFAMMRGNENVVEYLLSLNPKVDTVSDVGTDPLTVALLRGNFLAANRVAQHIDSNVMAANDNTRHISSKVKHVELLEMHGAFYADKGEFPKCLAMWEEALLERWSDHASPMLKTKPKKSVADILQVNEPQTVEELRIIAQSPQKLVNVSFLVKERLLGPCVLLGVRMQHLVWVQIDLGHMERSIHLLCRSMDILTDVAQSQRLKIGWLAEFPLHLRGIFEIERVRGRERLFLHKHVVLFLKLVRLAIFQGMESARLADPTSPHNSAPVEVHRCCKLCREMKNVMILFCQMMVLALELEDTATTESTEEFEALVRDMVEMNPQPFKMSLLHFCSFRNFDMRVAKLLIKASGKNLAEKTSNNGAVSSPVSRPLHLAWDLRGFTPLHLYVRSLSKEQLLDQGLLQLFLDHGAHLCSCCPKGSIFQILRKRGMDIPPFSHQSLKCLAAIALRNNPSFMPPAGDVPQKILLFLQDH